MNRLAVLLSTSLVLLAAPTLAWAGDAGPRRVNKVIELLEAGQPVYYTYGARPLDPAWTVAEAYEKGRSLAQTWADMIMYDMEHYPFDVTLLRAFMRGLADGGPTPSGHLTPAVIVTLPVLGLDEATVNAGHWMIQQVLAAGVHGVHLCRARSSEAVRSFVRMSRFTHQTLRVGDGLDQGLRGMGSQAFAARIWGVSNGDYFELADPWPLNPRGELLLGVKIEDPQALGAVESTLRVPGIGFAESGPRDMGLSYGYTEGRADPPLPPEVVAASERVLRAAKEVGIPFLDNVLPDNVVERLEWGVRIAAGGSREAAEIGRRHTGRTMPW
jgi:4-hydroxy-2-oxoheptanedioate aldolase